MPTTTTPALGTELIVMGPTIGLIVTPMEALVDQIMWIAHAVSQQTGTLHQQLSTIAKVEVIPSVVVAPGKGGRRIHLKTIIN